MWKVSVTEKSRSHYLLIVQTANNYETFKVSKNSQPIIKYYNFSYHRWSSDEIALLELIYEMFENTGEGRRRQYCLDYFARISPTISKAAFVSSLVWIRAQIPYY